MGADAPRELTRRCLPRQQRRGRQRRRRVAEEAAPALSRPERHSAMLCPCRERDWRPVERTERLEGVGGSRLVHFLAAEGGAQQEVDTRVVDLPVVWV